MNWGIRSEYCLSVPANSVDCRTLSILQSLPWIILSGLIENHGWNLFLWETQVSCIQCSLRQYKGDFKNLHGVFHISNICYFGCLYSYHASSKKYADLCTLLLCSTEPLTHFPLHTILLSVIHTKLLYSTTISLGYMFQLFSVIIRPY